MNEHEFVELRVKSDQAAELRKFKLQLEHVCMMVILKSRVILLG